MRISSRWSSILQGPALASALCVSLAGLGCASANRPPGWVDGAAPSEYPKERFVSALGAGPSLDAAQTAAKAELSRVFSSELESALRLIDEESVLDGVSAETSTLSVETTIDSAVELQGVEVPLHWRDPRSGETWSLAVLDRNTECLRIRAEGRDLVTRLDALAAESAAETNPLRGVRTATQALAVGMALDRLEARSRVLGSRCLAPRSLATGGLRAEADARLRNLSFVVKTEDVDGATGRAVGPLPQLREQIAGNLTRLGFQVGPTSGASVVPIEARLRLRRVDRGTDWVEYRWEGSAEIGSPEPGDSVIIAAESDGAESHPEASTARLRARRKGELDLSRKLDERLRAFLAESD